MSRDTSVTVERQSKLVDTTTLVVADVTQEPFFNIGVRESLETTIQVNWDNFSGSIDITFFGRASAKSQYGILKFHNEDGEIVDKAKIKNTKGNHQFHFDRKFNEIEVRFIVNTGSADVSVSALLE